MVSKTEIMYAILFCRVGERLAMFSPSSLFIAVLPSPRTRITGEIPLELECAFSFFLLLSYFFSFYINGYLFFAFLFTLL